MIDNNTVEKVVEQLNLIEIAKSVTIMAYVIQDITEDFFDKYDPSDKNDVASILWEYKRNRAKVKMIEDYIYSMEKQLEKNNISYWWGGEIAQVLKELKIPISFR